MPNNPIKPNFLIIGATKSATTSLSSLLKQHPDICIVKGKEPQFFSFDNQYNPGWEHYQSLYDHCKKSAMAFGDASTSYSRIRYHPNTIQRIKHHVPEVKNIYMVRQPLERMESAYIQHIEAAGIKGLMLTSISDAVTRQPMIVDSSRYWEVFDTYRQHSPEEHIKIVWFDEYINNRLSAYQDICHFLGVNDKFEFKSIRENANKRSTVLDRINNFGRNDTSIDTTWDPKIRQQVINTLRDDNLKFLQYFGKPVDYWGDLFD